MLYLYFSYKWQIHGEYPKPNQLRRNQSKGITEETRQCCCVQSFLVNKCRHQCSEATGTDVEDQNDQSKGLTGVDH